MVRCLMVRASGQEEEADLLHESVESWLGVQLTFVGAVDECHVFAVGRSTAESEPENAWCQREDCFHDLPVRGDVVFLASDDDGKPMDVDVVALKTFLGK